LPGTPGQIGHVDNIFWVADQDTCSLADKRPQVSGKYVGDEGSRGTEDMKVWIDQDLCTGDGLCEEIAPAVFTLLDDGLAYVKEGSEIKNDPGGSAGMAAVPEDLEDAVQEASEECPGECIFIEPG
jgi:ferredoxin